MVLPGPKPVDRLSGDVGLIGHTQVRKKRENNNSFYKAGKAKKRERG